MPTKLKDLRTKTDDELVEWIAGWKEGTFDHVIGMLELKRRQERPNEIRGWIAIFIAALAVILSFAAILVAILVAK